MAIQNPQKRLVRFDPEGSDYDYVSALAAGVRPDKTGHWPSRDPQTGLILKGRKHPTFHKTIKADEELGYRMIRKDGRYYSIKKNWIDRAYRRGAP